MASHRDVFADRERLKAEARHNRVVLAAQSQKSDDEDTPPSLFGAPIKRETVVDDAVAVRAKNLLGCYDTVQTSIQQHSRHLIGVSRGPQTPAVHAQQASPFSAPVKKSSKSRSSSTEKRRSRSRDNEDAANNKRDERHQVNGGGNANAPRPNNNKNDSLLKERVFSNGYSRIETEPVPNRPKTDPTKPSQKPNLPNLKINSESRAGPVDSFPALENILQEMKSLHPPLTAIHTPRKDDIKFPFHREDVRKVVRPVQNGVIDRSSVNIPSQLTKTTAKSRRLEDSDSDIDDAHGDSTVLPVSPVSVSSNRPTNGMAVVSRSATVHDNKTTMLGALSCSSSSESGSESSSSGSSSDSDSDSSSDDDDDDDDAAAAAAAKKKTAPNKMTQLSLPRTPQPEAQQEDDDDGKVSWNLEKIMLNMKKTSPCAVVLDTSASDQNPASNASTNAREGEFMEFDIRDSWKDHDLPPLVSPLDKAKNISKTPDPPLSSSDMDISDAEPEEPAKVVRRRSSSVREKISEVEVVERKAPVEPVRATVLEKRSASARVHSSRAAETDAKAIAGSVTPKPHFKTKAERKSIQHSYLSESSDDDVDVVNNTPVKQRANHVTQALRLKQLTDDTRDDVTRERKRSRSRDSKRSGKTKTRANADRASVKSRKACETETNWEESASSPSQLLRNILYVNGRPSIVVHLNLNLIARVPGAGAIELNCGSPERESVMEKADSSDSETEETNAKRLTADMDVSSSSSEDEPENMDDCAAELPSAITPIKSPLAERPALRFDQLPKIPKRKLPDSPDSDSAKRYRSHTLNIHSRQAQSCNLSNDGFKRSPSPESTSSFRSAQPAQRVTPQWLQEPALAPSAVVNANATSASAASVGGVGGARSVNVSERSGKKFDAAVDLAPMPGLTDFSQFNKIRDWDAPSQSSVAPYASGYRSAQQSWSALGSGLPGDKADEFSQRDPFRTDDDRQQTHNHYLSEAKKLKHHADKLNDVLTKSLTYVEAVLCFIQCGNAMELEQLPSPERPDRIVKMYNDTLLLIKNILRGRSDVPEMQENGDKGFKLHVLSNRIQALLSLKLFKLKRQEASKLKKIIDEYAKTDLKPRSSTQAPSPYGSQGWPRSTGTPSPMSSSPSPASVGSVSSQTGNGSGTTPTCSGAAASGGSTVAIPQRIHTVTQQYISTLNHLYSCHELWDQAELQSHSHKEFFAELDHHCGVLTLHSSILHLVKYVRLGLHRLKDT